ncbi:IS200/IS605 family accessory protein TnpB-related protein [Thermocrinis sp.]
MNKAVQKEARTKKKRILIFPTTLQFKVIFERREELEKVKDLMRRQSSAIRAIYQRLKKGQSQKEIYDYIKETYKLSPWYISSAIQVARALPKDKKVIFGGKSLFEKLKKNHLQGKRREELKREWREKRQGRLLSMGSEKHKGNHCMRFEEKEGVLYLNIEVGERKFVSARVKREPSNEKDKWLTFLSMLFESWRSQRWFPYEVELKLKDGEVYGYVSFDYPVPEVEITRRYGVIAIDTNASPLHLAVAELSEDGNLVSYQKISLHNFWQYSKNRRENEEWLIAHQIVDLAYSKGKAIAIEDLKKVNKGYRGDGKAKVRKRLHHWNFRSLLQKIERVARLKGIEVVKVYPAYTSIIGMLKYAPQLGIDKDVAGAYLIGRRALGFEEEMPRNYEKLLKDREFLRSALEFYRQEEQRLSGLLDKEKNEYKQNALKDELSKVQFAVELVERDLKKLGRKKKKQSHQSEPVSCLETPTEGRVGQERRKTSLKHWRVLRVVLFVPVLGKALPRDFSSLKELLISGKWDRERVGPVPFGFGGA